MFEVLEEGFLVVVRYAILILEAVGVAVLLASAFKALVCVFKSQSASKRVLAEGTTTALSFLLGGELLNTIIAPDWHDVGMTCAVLLMRAAMTLLIHWENKHESD